MKKRKQTKSQAKKEDKPVTLGDRLNNDLMSQLKAKQKELKEQEEKKQQEQKEIAAKKRREEQKRREKNMSFEELLAQSDMDWEKFK
ncbi:YqkE family protein [Mesobacillus maritimus]|uniref:YqkE family protein n=1 Tax=Mesobacillus maritimus TaxID=1643336 RepID=UPI00203B5A70|nr:YqkE family protein [Mesobacillus maritimus]MCM3586429.1 YqkE family protein [Mesobacillus maritimus]MCM3669539.1 YqkE family protein [Mesobacillus maritimus]